jgi:hypothetical protein
MFSSCGSARHHNYDIEGRISHKFTLVQIWSPRFEPFQDPREWPPYDGPKYVADPAYRWEKCGSRKRMRHKMDMDQTPFLPNLEQYEYGK